jgi:putative phosphoribosyl transferase
MDERIPLADVTLDGDVEVPDAARGVVVFAHGSGSGRHSPRNRFVAERLRDAGLATVLTDLLTPEEEQADAVTGVHRFDIRLLARRVVGLVDWVADHETLAGLGVGLFGASTGAAAALVAAAARPEVVRAVVSRGGRPDLASDVLRSVRQRTLLIVGGRDEVVLDLNRAAGQALAGPTRLEIVPDATHLFTEPGALERVAELAAEWFSRHLPPEPDLIVGPG